MRYVLRYDIWDEQDVVDEFEGSYHELRERIEKLRAIGATNISSYGYDAEDEE